MTDLAPLPLSRLACDGPLPAALYELRDGAPRLLLAAGQPVTAANLARLRDRGVRELAVDRAFLAAVSTPDPAAAPGGDDEEVREPVPAAATRRLGPDAFLRTLTRPAGPATPAREAAAAARRDALAGGVADLLAAADPARPAFAGRFASSSNHSASNRSARPAVDGAGLRSLGGQIVAGLAADYDLFARVGLDFAVPPDGDPGRDTDRDPGAARLREQAVRSAHLAIAVGAAAGLRREDLEALAMGCLVHDAGMLRVPRAAWDGPGRLDAAAFAAVRRHPAHTYELLCGVRGLPPGARAVAVQLHERADGSGYPLGLAGVRVHPLARIAAVADAYCGMTADRPHRPARTPHDAVRTLAAGAVRGAFDADAVRALLEAVGAFPVGSGVRLSDGRRGRVARAAPDRPAGPRVELRDPLTGRYTGEWVEVGVATAAGRTRVVALD